jgi:WXXGXW repeat (2 copies)
MKTKVLVILLLAGTSLFARTHVSIGIGIGGYSPYGYYPAPPPAYYAPPPPVYYAPPAYPYYAPSSIWISGYYYPVGPRRVWREGYWARPPYAGARWVSPYWVGGRFRPGYWRR